ncbi:MAG: substrate-binding domain-containing protein [Geminicoccaceae bacterium]
MKRFAFGAALLATTALAGQAMAREEIRIVGSSTVFPFSTAVAEEFGRSSDFPAPVVESTGSGGGLQLFCSGIGEGHPDITNASRRIKQSEVETCSSAGITEITEVKIGYDGIVLANVKDAPQLDLSREQIWQALAKDVVVDGEVVANPNTNWSDIDPSLPDTQIEVLGPPPTSGTRDAFVELVMEEGCESSVEGLGEDEAEAVCKTMREDGAFVEAGENDNLIVQKLQENPDALGIFGFSFLDQNADVMQGSMIEGNEPAFDAIAAGDYPVSRSLFFYVKNAHVGVIPGIEEYLAEFTSDKAIGEDGYLADKGLIPLPEEEREEVRTQTANLQPLSLN